MDSGNGLITQIDDLFHPGSIAIVGVPRGMKTGKLFLISLLDMGFPGPIYPVHPEADEIDGLKAYPSVSAIPGSVDLAIVLVPQQGTLPVVRECAEKGVKGVVLFTAGYKETGTAEGLALEGELLSVARSAGMRLIGPNCVGLYAPRTQLSFLPELSREPGPVGIISHSGSLAQILARVAPKKGVRFSKVVSLGNECDLSSADFLAYLGRDPETQVIGGYLEGIKDGPRFLNALRAASLEKPVILWKQGLTEEGSRAAASHTGAMTGSREVWEGVVSQGGAVSVVGFEAWMDALMGFALLPANLGHRIAIVSGPGGVAVSAAEACGRVGLDLADFTPSTREKLGEVVPPTGTSVRNPIDVGMTASMQIEIFTHAARIAAADPGVDAVVVAGVGINDETNRRYTEAMIETRRDLEKPLVLVAVPGFDPGFGRTFGEAGLPFFETVERAMDTYAQVRRYQLRRRERKGGA